MKRLFALGALLFGLSPVFAQEKPVFPDVPQGHWAFSAVQRLAKEGILQGYPSSEPTREATVTPQSKVASKQAVSLNDALRITSLVKTELGATAALRGAQIDVDTNVETRQAVLRGTSLSQYQKALAGQIARKHAKGYSIVNSVQVSKR